MKKPSRSARGLGLLLALSVTGVAGATTWVMPTDGELLARAELVVVARVVDVAAAPVAPIQTDVTLEIEEIVRGFAPGSTVILRQMGGVDAARESFLLVHGQALLEPGDRALLFLGARPDGTYRTLDLGLGSFREVEGPGGERLAVRRHGAAHEVTLPGDAAASERARSHRTRRFGPFVEWLEDAVRGHSREPDYFVDPASPLARIASATSGAEVASEFTLIRGCSGNLPVRRLAFDQGLSVRHLANASGQPGVPGGGLSLLQTAMDAWNAPGESDIRLRYAGTTALTGTSGSDGFNLVVFEDPNDVIEGSFTGSGTLAVTLSRGLCRNHSFPNGTAVELTEADVVGQNGLGRNYFPRSTSPAAVFMEIFAHEFGHTLGLGHSCGDDASPACSSSRLDEALMRSSIHNDGRGARLNADDRAAAAFLYGEPQRATAPRPPNNLIATSLSADSVRLAWNDRATDEEAYEVQTRRPGGDWTHLITLGRNEVALIVDGLAEASVHQFRVRATNDAGPSAWSEEATAVTFAVVGPCVTDQRTLCLAGSRFRVRARWRTLAVGGEPAGSGDGGARPLTDDTGTFWFFDPANVEMVVKVLDACAFADRFWVFAGGLTNVAVELTVSDLHTGVVRPYFNPQSTPFQPIQDTTAFATCAEDEAWATAPAGSEPREHGGSRT